MARRSFTSLFRCREARKVYRILIMSKYSANEKDALWQHPHVRGEGVRVVEYNGEPWETPPRAWGRQRDFIVFFISFYFYSYFKAAASRPRSPLSAARHNRTVDFPPSLPPDASLFFRCLPAGLRPVFSRCGRLPAGLRPPPKPLMQRWRGREGDPVRPQGGRSAAAGADITRPTGPGRFAPMPRAPRGGRGTVQFKRRLSGYRTKGSTGVQGV